MIYIYNFFLIIFGIPLFGTTLTMAGFFYPISSPVVPFDVTIVMTWIISLALFCFTYIQRSKWLIEKGIFKSWGIFQRFLREHHKLPLKTEAQFREFCSWLNVESIKQLQNVDSDESIAKKIYNRIVSEVQPEERMKMFMYIWAECIEETSTTRSIYPCQIRWEKFK